MRTICSNTALLQCLNEAETAGYHLHHEEKLTALLQCLNEADTALQHEEKLTALLQCLNEAETALQGTKCSMKRNCSNTALLQCLNEAETTAYKVQHEDKQLAALHLPVALHYSEQQLAADVLDYSSCEAAISV